MSSRALPDHDSPCFFMEKAFFQRRLSQNLLLTLWLFLFIGSTTPAFAQNRTSNDILDTQTFRFRDGLDVGFIQSLEFDDEGWLWISGLESESGSNDFLNKGIKLQRFDGLSFHTVALPKVSETSFVSCELFKRKDGLFYVMYDGEDEDYLFLFDPLSFGFTNIELPDVTNITEISGIFPSNESTFLTIDYGADTYLYELDDDLNISKLFSIQRGRAGNSFLNDVIKFDDHFLISEERAGIYAYSLEGTILKFFDYKDLVIDIPVPFEPLVIRNKFRYEGGYYFDFREEELPFMYDPEKMKFINTEGLNTDPRIVIEKTGQGYYRGIVADELNNFATFSYIKSGIVLSRYLESSSFGVKKSKITTQDLSSMNSRNLSKELFIGELGRLRHITFRNSPIVTFLEDHSVRSIMHWQGDEYLVASEYKGWFMIDVSKGTERFIELKVNGRPFIATETRGMYRDKYGLWSNYNGGFILVDPQTFEVELFREFPIWAMVDAGDKIYFGSYLYPLSLFNKETRTYQKLSKNDSLVARDIEFINNTVYMTTDQGLLKYKNGKESFVDFELPEGDFMMLEKHDSLKLLVTTTLGDVYQFNPENDEHRLLYKHSVNNPIASILIANDGKLWMNTFSGIISLNLQTGETEHFLEEDGLSNNEGNRYSEINTVDGGFLMGSIKGLNYFHPNSISKAPVDVELKLTAFTRYLKAKKANVTEGNRAKLDKIEKIILPAENRYLKVEVAPLRMISNLNTNIQYRLNEGVWQTRYNSGTIELINMAAGSYLLETRLINTDNQPISKSLFIAIEAKEFFYKTTWFITLVLLLVAAISYYFIRQANRAKKLEQNFSRSLLKVQEGERTRISRELHDSVGQQLILLKNQAKVLQSPEMEQTASATLEEVRTITRDLHPVVLTQLGLTAALEDMIHKLDANTEIFFSTELENVDNLLAKDEELNLYRIVQEALNNIVKHAQAASARLTIERSKSKLTLTIQDNGNGFDVSQGESAANSLGLKTLNERATMLNARLKINSSDKGTRVVLEVPR